MTLQLLRSEFEALCSDCGEPRDGAHPSYCRSCNTKRRAAYKARNPATYLKYDRDRQMRRFGATHDFDEQLKRQKGLCGCCDEPLVLTKGRYGIDHDHVTNRLRSILCHSCNGLLGMAQDDVRRLEKAIDYLNTHEQAIVIQETDMAGNPLQ